MQALEQIKALSTEVANLIRNVDFLHNSNNEKAQQIDEQQKKSDEMTNQVNALTTGRSGNNGDTKVNLVDVKSMAPKGFAGAANEGFKGWAKKVRAYCNANLHGYRHFLVWIEAQAATVDDQAIQTIDWKHRDAASSALYDFLVLHTTDDAQNLVELQDGNGPEAWRQLCLRYDPIGESFVFDTMAKLMEAERCTKMTELPAAITRWKKSLSAFTKKTGKTIPDEWRLPILFKMIPAKQYDTIKLRYNYATPEQKSFEASRRP